MLTISNCIASLSKWMLEMERNPNKNELNNKRTKASMMKIFENCQNRMDNFIFLLASESEWKIYMNIMDTFLVLGNDESRRKVGAKEAFSPLQRGRPTMLSAGDVDKIRCNFLSFFWPIYAKKKRPYNLNINDWLQVKMMQHKI